MAKQTVRLDVLVVERGLLPSRQSAQAAIIDGGILVNGQKITKPGTPVDPQCALQLTAQWQPSKYVSRGGLKLEKALAEFAFDVSGLICLDVGASTGGFTDCLLQHGARLVYAIDVGYGQLDWKLRQDARVIVKERVNARAISAAELYGDSGEPASLAVFDVSFISISKVLPNVLSLLQPECTVISLIKPQFEAGRQHVGKGGVVRDKAVHAEVLETVLSKMEPLELQLRGLTFSPVKGPAGNIEFLGMWQRTAQHLDCEVRVSDVVEQAHAKLNDK